MSERWILKSKDINEIVEASDLFEAYDHLREYGVLRFGLLVDGRKEGAADDDSYLIRTSALMGRWGRYDDARKFCELAKKAGYGDTFRDCDPMTNPQVATP